jgi:hypothetical protein
MVKRHSTLFPLAFVNGSQVLRVYYKQFHPPVLVDEKKWHARLSEALTRCRHLTESFNELASGESVKSAPILAVDAEQLIVVTQAIEGQSIERLIGRRGLYRAFMPMLRSRVLSLCEKLGRAAHLLETCSEGFCVPGGATLLGSNCKDLLEVAISAGHLSRQEADAIFVRLEQLYDEAVKGDNSFVYAHCDFAPHNFAFRGKAIGFFDCMFGIRLRGFDVALLTSRLEYQSFSSLWSHSLIEAVLSGYGDLGLTQRANWRFSRLHTALRHLRNKRWAEKALSEIRSLA